MKKIISIGLIILMMCSICVGCGDSSNPIVAKLEDADYNAAYELAKTDGEKNLVRSENAIAYICDYFASAMEYSGIEDYEMTVTDAYAKGHQKDGVKEARYAVKFDCVQNEKTISYYYYFVYSVDEKDFKTKELFEAELIEGFNDMTMEEQLAVEGLFNAGYWINMMNDDSGLYGYQMPDDTVKRINKLIKNGKIDGVDISNNSQCEELPWKTKFE